MRTLGVWFELAGLGEDGGRVEHRDALVDALDGSLDHQVTNGSLARRIDQRRNLRVRITTSENQTKTRKLIRIQISQIHSNRILNRTGSPW